MSPKSILPGDDSQYPPEETKATFPSSILVFIYPDIAESIVLFVLAIFLSIL